MGQFFKQYLEPIKLNDVQVCKHLAFIPLFFLSLLFSETIFSPVWKVDWKSVDLSYLEEVHSFIIIVECPNGLN